VDCFMSPRYLATIKAASGSSYNDAIASQTSTITLPSSSVKLRSQFSHTHYPFSLSLSLSLPSSCYPHKTQYLLCTFESVKKRKKLWKKSCEENWSVIVLIICKLFRDREELYFCLPFNHGVFCFVFALCLCCFCHWNLGLFLWKIHR
jgi:hypothetical protein